jgi:hypothetical protein
VSERYVVRTFPTIPQKAGHPNSEGRIFGSARRQWPLLFLSPSCLLPLMAPKPTFKVKVPKSDWENHFPPSMATNTWALAGSEAEGRLQAKAKRGFDSSIVRKSHLHYWNLNIWDTIGGDGTSHTTSFAHGVPPTPQSPTNFDCPIVSDEVLAVERDGWMRSQPPFPL